ncbi:hypothetical protein PV318_00105 [Streptomyces sp. ME02-6991-2B]|nr:hypothetical protein [Streptomyces sp. ME02-6991-2B]
MAIIVAVVGVAGTLVAPLTTASIGARARLQEFELQQRAEETARSHAQELAELERRRQAYIALNSSARLWRIRLMEDYHAFRSGQLPVAAADEARMAFQNDFAQAQMLVPDVVLEAANRVRIGLADARKRLERLRSGGATHAGEEGQGVYVYLLGQWDAITRMQGAMRKDLGVGTGEPLPSERTDSDSPGVP